jgi:hypothetical protein
MAKNNPKKAQKALLNNKKKEIGGPSGLEPTRYGVHSPEWERKGRVSDF